MNDDKTTTRVHLWHCMNKHCPAYHVQLPKETGPGSQYADSLAHRDHMCSTCGEPMRWVRSTQ